MTRSLGLRLAALAVLAGALILSGSCLREWLGMRGDIPLFDPHVTRSLLASPWVAALPSLLPLLLNASGIALLLQARAARIDQQTVQSVLPVQGSGEGGGEYGLPPVAAGSRVRIPYAFAMKALATAIILGCAVVLVGSLVNPVVYWSTLTGVAMMIHRVGGAGLLALFGTIAVIITLLLISLTIAILLYSETPPGVRSDRDTAAPGGGAP